MLSSVSKRVAIGACLSASLCACFTVPPIRLSSCQLYNGPERSLEEVAAVLCGGGLWIRDITGENIDSERVEEKKRLWNVRHWIPTRVGPQSVLHSEMVGQRAARYSDDPERRKQGTTLAIGRRPITLLPGIYGLEVFFDAAWYYEGVYTYSDVSLRVRMKAGHRYYIVGEVEKTKDHLFADDEYKGSVRAVNLCTRFCSNAPCEDTPQWDDYWEAGSYWFSFEEDISDAASVEAAGPQE